MTQAPPHEGPRRGLVLAGGGARGAYEAGVLSYIMQELPAELISPGKIRVFCGTSVGAIHAGYLAATAHLPRHDIGRMVDLWRSLRLEKMLRLRARDVVALPREVRALFAPDTGAHGVLINSSLLRDVVMRNAPWERIGPNLEAGYFDAVTASCTHIVSGKTTVFVDRREPGLPAWSRDPRVEPRRVRLTADHVLASAAIPLLFPPVRLEGSYYSDGGLRQNTPLSPALRLGCDRVLVVALRHEDPRPPPKPITARAGAGMPIDGTPSERFPSAFFLLGKVVDAIMLDRLEYDILRLEGFNTILRDGEQAFGPKFTESLSASTMRIRGAGYRPISPLVIRPSRDIGEMAYEFIEVLRRQLGRFPGWLLGLLAAGDVLGESDLLSYVLFDGRIGAALIELGRADADAARSQLIEFFRD